MKSVLFDIAVVTVCFLWLAKLNIKFKPFSITFEAPYLALGWLALCTAILLFSIHYQNEGYKKGLTENVKQEVREILSRQQK